MNIQGGYTYKDRCGKKDHIYIIMIQQIYNGTSKNMVYIKKKSSGAENIFQVSYIQFKQKQFYTHIGYHNMLIDITYMFNNNEKIWQMFVTQRGIFRFPF